jgi:hypothetical protein
LRERYAPLQNSADQVCTHWAFDIFERLFSNVIKLKIQPIAELVSRRAGDQDARSWRQTFQPGGDVHAVTKQVSVLHDDIAHVDPDAHGERTVLG